ncbi:MAG: nfuA 2 [Gemmataceae bacterium]|nr:nfuA 2 [Gemmataceae bacterium]
MADPPDDGEFRAKLRRLEALIGQAEQLTDPAARAHVREIVQALLDLYGTGLGRILDHVAAAGEAGAAVLDACAADEVAGGLLLLHGLHPLGVEDRVRQALGQARPALRAHGGVELLGVDDGIVRVRFEAACDGCPSTAAAMRQTIEEAIYARAPEVVAVEVEGLEETPAGGGAARVALPVL